MFKLSTDRVDVSKYVSSKAKPNADLEAAKPQVLDQTLGQTHQQSSPAAAPVDKESYQRANATFVTLARNSDLWELVNSIREVEDRFNHKYGYDWVFLNDQPFDENFIKITSMLISGKTKYDVIPKEWWSFPEWIDQEKAAKVRQEMREKKVIYGDSVPYRHMCRFESGFFWRHPALDEYKYYWRVEPGVHLFCDIEYDLFKFMEDNQKQYAFTISLYEYIETIPTLWEATKQFIKANPQYIAKDSMMDFISDDGGETYNRCHFWSNFEIASLDLWRSEAYTKYFDHLDKAGGFFYERWGDAPVHSIGASLFLNKDEIHYFDDVGYFHVPFSNCPTSEEVRLKKKCICNPDDNFTWKGYSCTPRYYKVKDLERPKGWQDQS
ncbi:alpha-1,2 mannosyltransferase Ktr1p [Trichomonascus vanleenenianus]|uniref:glycosyltransferase family 15 protein n=1 Tax=Trichomonascus vanleenenianus TaxID=2268995 RepID=UPI003ECB1894